MSPLELNLTICVTRDERLRLLAVELRIRYIGEVVVGADHIEAAAEALLGRQLNRSFRGVQIVIDVLKRRK